MRPMDEPKDTRNDKRRIQRKRVAKSPPHANDLVSRVMETSPAGITVVDRTGQIVYANAQAERILDLSKKKTTRRTYNAPTWRITDYAGRPFPDEELPFERVMATKKPVADVRHAIEWPDGQRVLLTINAAPLLDDQGEVEAVVAAIEDVTERVRAERALRESEEQYRHFIERATDGIVLVSDGVIRFANPRTAEMWGGTAAEIVGTPFVDYVHPEERSKVLDRYARRMAGEEIAAIYETVVLRKDGTSFYAELKAGSVTYHGELADLVFVRDITERKRAEESTRKQRQIFESILEQSLSGYWEWGIQDNTEYLSPGYKKMLGYEDHELANRPETWQALILPEDLPRVLDLTRKHIESHGKVPYHLELRFRHKNGSTVWVICAGHVVEWDAQGRAVRMVGCHVDITALKRAEDEIRREELQKDLALAVGELGAWRLDLATGKTWRSLRYDQIFGYPTLLPEWTYEMFLSHVLAEDRGAVAESYGNALSNKTDWDFTCRIRREDGEVRWIWARGKPELNKRHEPVALVGLVQDITARKHAEETLRQSEERFRTLYENATIGLYRTTPDGSILLANPTLVTMLGFSSFEELSAKNLETDSFEQSYARSEFLERVEGTGEVKGLEAAWTRRDGTQVFVRESARAIRDSDGKTLFYDGTVEDITERKQAQDALANSELNYRQVVENASEAIFVVHGGRIVFLNPMTCALIGYSGEELMARPFPKFIHPDDRDMVLKRYRARMEGEESQGVFVFRVVRNDGAVRWAELSAVLIDWQGEPAVLNLVSDITERREASDRLRKSLEGTIKAVVLTTEIRDPYTAGHQERVARLACAIAEKMGLGEETVKGLRVAGLLHDVGKVSVPAEILSKPARLTPAEFNLIKAHPQTGYEILKGIDFPWPAAEIVLEHHERLDGSGYPRGLTGEAILPMAKILAVADVVEAMSSHRPYRPALGVDKALGELEAGAGTLYDREVVKVCLQLFQEGYELSLPLLPEASQV